MMQNGSLQTPAPCSCTSGCTTRSYKAPWQATHHGYFHRHIGACKYLDGPISNILPLHFSAASVGAVWDHVCWTALQRLVVWWLCALRDAQHLNSPSPGPVAWCRSPSWSPRARSDESEETRSARGLDPGRCFRRCAWHSGYPCVASSDRFAVCRNAHSPKLVKVRLFERWTCLKLVLKSRLSRWCGLVYLLLCYPGQGDDVVESAIFLG